jgi:hypothetical protein
MIDLRSTEFQFVGVSSSADDATAAKMPSPELAAVAFNSINSIPDIARA